MADEALEQFWKVLEFFNPLRYFLTLRRIDRHLAKREIVAFPTTSVYGEYCGYRLSSIRENDFKIQPLQLAVVVFRLLKRLLRFSCEFCCCSLFLSEAGGCCSEFSGLHSSA